MDSLTALKEALRLWRDSAESVLRQNRRNTIRGQQPNGWRVTSTQHPNYLKAQREPIVEYWSLELRETLKALPTWQTVLDAARPLEHARYLIPTDDPGRAIELCPTPSELDEGVDPFEASFEQIAPILRGESPPQETTWIIPALYPVDLDLPLELEPGVTLRRPLPEDMESGLRGRAFEPDWDGFVFDLDRAGLCLSYAHTGSPEALEERDRIGRTLTEAMALVLPRTVRVAGELTASASPRFRRGGMTRAIHPARTLDLAWCWLKPTLMNEFQSTWGDLRKSWPNRPAALALALRRLTYDRMSLEDDLIDTMVAAEALYLSKSDKSESTYKLAVRAAQYQTPVTDTLGQRQAFELMKKAYGERSTVVHGGELKENKQIKVGGAEYEVRSLVSYARQLVQAACRRAIREVAQGQAWPPDWESLLLT